MIEKIVLYAALLAFIMYGLICKCGSDDDSFDKALEKCEPVKFRIFVASFCVAGFVVVFSNFAQVAVDAIMKYFGG